MHNEEVAEVTDPWFRGTNATSDTEFRFVSRLRQLAPGWAGMGLRAERSMGVPVPRPLVGVELAHLTATLRWLWILFITTDDGLSIDCQWGDDTRFNDWGPVDGNVYASTSGAHAAPEGLAEQAALWVATQAARPIRREEWIGRRGRTRWSFEDSRAVLFDTRPTIWSPKRSPDVVQMEEVVR